MHYFSKKYHILNHCLLLSTRFFYISEVNKSHKTKLSELNSPTYTFLLHVTLKLKRYNSIKGTNLNVKFTLTFFTIRNDREESRNGDTALLNFATLGSTPIAEILRWLVDSKSIK